MATVNSHYPTADPRSFVKRFLFSHVETKEQEPGNMVVTRGRERDLVVCYFLNTFCISCSSQYLLISVSVGSEENGA